MKHYFDKEYGQSLHPDRFFQTFWIDYFACDYVNFLERKNVLTMFSGGFDNKVIDFVRI